MMDNSLLSFLMKLVCSSASSGVPCDVVTVSKGKRIRNNLDKTPVGKLFVQFYSSECLCKTDFLTRKLEAGLLRE